MSQRIHESLRGKKCPKCGQVYTHTTTDQPPPTEEMLANPNFVWVVVCTGCTELVRIQQGVVSLLGVAELMHLEQEQPNLVKALRQSQRFAYVTKTRREAARN